MRTVKSLLCAGAALVFALIGTGCIDLRPGVDTNTVSRRDSVTATDRFASDLPSASNREGSNDPAVESPVRSGEGGVVEISFAGVTSDATKEASQLWKEIVERESDGTVVVNLYPDNMLADDVVAIETTQRGNIHIATSSTSPLCELYPDFYLFDAPYLFLSEDQVYSVMDGAVGQELLNGLEGLGLKGMMLWENGFRNLTNDLLPVSSPDDLQGLRVRTMENDVHQTAWEAFGAIPIAMPFQGVYTALQNGEIDAQENALGVIDGNKFQDVNRYISLTQHVYTPYVIVMNLDRWNSLSASQQAAMETANREATEFQRRRSQEIEAQVLSSFERSGVEVIHLSDEDKSAFQQIIADHNIFEQVKEKMDHPQYLDQVLAG